MRRLAVSTARCSNSRAPPLHRHTAPMPATATGSSTPRAGRPGASHLPFSGLPRRSCRPHPSPELAACSLPHFSLAQLHLLPPDAQEQSNETTRTIQNLRASLHRFQIPHTRSSLTSLAPSPAPQNRAPAVARPGIKDSPTIRPPWTAHPPLTIELLAPAIIFFV